jgi:hydroxymethylpyrimidine/phosphomethylpyrimidine kinase
MKPPIALTVAGSDSSGGAGIQADLKTFTVLGVYGASVLTAVTAQNTQGVRRAAVLDVELIIAQLDAAATDLPVAAAKTGMLATSEVIDAVAAGVQRHGLHPLVVDPVMVAKSGDLLIDEAAVATLRRRLLPLATVLTPNRHEAARLLDDDGTIDGVREAAEAASRLCARCGVGACVITGVPRPGKDDGQSVDVLFDGRSVHEIAGPRYRDRGTHGSGCTFSAAAAAALAQGQDLLEAIRTARAFVDSALRDAPPLGRGNSPLDHLAPLRERP